MTDWPENAGNIPTCYNTAYPYPDEVEEANQLIIPDDCQSELEALLSQPSTMSMILSPPIMPPPVMPPPVMPPPIMPPPIMPPPIMPPPIMPPPIMPPPLMPPPMMPPPKPKVNPRELRNKAEKQRRDQMNQTIAHLSKIVPLVAASPKKVDKTSVLRLTAHFLRSYHHVFGKTLMTEIGERHPQFSLNFANELLKSMKGFLITCTYKGLIVVTSSNVQQYFGYSELDLVGRSLFGLIHPEDIETLKDQLFPRSCNFTSNGELLLSKEPDAARKVAEALKHERRNFTIRIKKASHSRTEPPKYVSCNVEGSFRKSDRAGVFVDKIIQTGRRIRSKGKNPYASGNDVVFIGLVRPASDTFVSESLMETFKLEYHTRHSVDGRIVQCEQRIAMITGYFGMEVEGLNAMNFIHKRDMRWVVLALREMFDKNYIIGESCYRLVTKNGIILYMRTAGCLEVDPETLRATSFVCTNTVLEKELGKKLIRKMKNKYSLMVNKEEYKEDEKEQVDDERFLPVEEPRQLEKIIFHLVTDLPAPDSQNSQNPGIRIIPPKREDIQRAIQNSYSILSTIRTTDPRYQNESILYSRPENQPSTSAGFPEEDSSPKYPLFPESSYACTNSTFLQVSRPRTSVVLPERRILPKESAVLPKKTHAPLKSAALPKKTHSPSKSAVHPKKTHVPLKSAVYPKKTHSPSKSAVHPKKTYSPRKSAIPPKKHYSHEKFAAPPKKNYSHAKSTVVLETNLSQSADSDKQRNLDLATTIMPVVPNSTPFSTASYANTNSTTSYANTNSTTSYANTNSTTSYVNTNSTSYPEYNPTSDTELLDLFSGSNFNLTQYSDLSDIASYVEPPAAENACANNISCEIPESFWVDTNPVSTNETGQSNNDEIGQEKSASPENVIENIETAEFMKRDISATVRNLKMINRIEMQNEGVFGNYDYVDSQLSYTPYAVTSADTVGSGHNCQILKIPAIPTASTSTSNTNSTNGSNDLSNNTEIKMEQTQQIDNKFEQTSGFHHVVDNYINDLRLLESAIAASKALAEANITDDMLEDSSPDASNTTPVPFENDREETLDHEVGINNKVNILIQRLFAVDEDMESKHIL